VTDEQMAVMLDHDPKAWLTARAPVALDAT
jgi:hypothetical protein